MEGKREREDFFGVSLLPCLGGISLIKIYLFELSWAELSCILSVVLNPLFCHSKFLLWWDKNWGREISQPEISIPTFWKVFFCYKWMLSFVGCLFYIFWDNYIIFILNSLTCFIIWMDLCMLNYLCIVEWISLDHGIWSL